MILQVSEASELPTRDGDAGDGWMQKSGKHVGPNFTLPETEYESQVTTIL